MIKGVTHTYLGLYNLASSKTFWCPLFSKPVSCLGLFFAGSYSKIALAGLVISITNLDITYRIQITYWDYNIKHFITYLSRVLCMVIAQFVHGNKIFIRTTDYGHPVRDFFPNIHISNILTDRVDWLSSNIVRCLVFWAAFSVHILSLHLRNPWFSINHLQP